MPDNCREIVTERCWFLFLIPKAAQGQEKHITGTQFNNYSWDNAKRKMIDFKDMIDTKTDIFKKYVRDPSHSQHEIKIGINEDLPGPY